MAADQPSNAAGRPRRAADSPRWCERCQKYGDHHTDRHDMHEPTTAVRCPCIGYDPESDEDYAACACGHSMEEHTPECVGELDVS